MTKTNARKNTKKKKTNKSPAAKNKKNKVEHPRNPLSYSLVRHGIILGQD